MIHKLQPLIREIRQYQVELDFNDVPYDERETFDGTDADYRDYLEKIAKDTGVYFDMWECR